MNESNWPGIGVPGGGQWWGVARPHGTPPAEFRFILLPFSSFGEAESTRLRVSPRIKNKTVASYLDEKKLGHSQRNNRRADFFFKVVISDDGTIKQIIYSL